MISKYYEIEKFKNKTNYFLFYGENEGQKQDVIQANFAKFTKDMKSSIDKDVRQGRIDDIIGNAGSTLDTLGELSASLADDSGSLATLTTTVGTK